jgi:hypothetical protein
LAQELLRMNRVQLFSRLPVFRAIRFCAKFSRFFFVLVKIRVSSHSFAGMPLPGMQQHRLRGQHPTRRKQQLSIGATLRVLRPLGWALQ